VLREGITDNIQFAPSFEETSSLNRARTEKNKTRYLTQRGLQKRYLPQGVVKRQTRSWQERGKGRKGLGEEGGGVGAIGKHFPWPQVRFSDRHKAFPLVLSYTNCWKHSWETVGGHVGETQPERQSEKIESMSRNTGTRIKLRDSAENPRKQNERSDEKRRGR